MSKSSQKKSAVANSVTSAVNSSRQISPSYYREKIYLEPDLDNVFIEFFGKIGGCKIVEVVDLLTGLARRGVKIPPQYLPQLLGRINLLSEQKESAPSVAQIGLILNNLADLGFKKSELKNLEIKKLVKIFDAQNNVSRNDITSVLNGCVRLAYDKKELSLDIKNLRGHVNLKFNNFNEQQKINFLNSLARMGYDANDFELLPTLLKMFDGLPQELENLEGKDVAALVHSCAKLEMFDQLFARREAIILALEPKILNLSSQSAFSLLQAEMFCDLRRHEKFFHKEAIISEIESRYEVPKEEISKLQQLVFDTLKSVRRKIPKISQEDPVYKVAEKPIRNIDISFSFLGTNGTYNVYCEVDGTSHYFNSRGQHILDSGSEARDLINELAIAKKENGSLINPRYFKVSFFEIEQNKHDLKKFLLGKINSAKVIAPSQQRPYKEFGKSVFAIPQSDLKADSTLVKSDYSSASLSNSEIEKTISNLSLAEPSYSSDFETALMGAIAALKEDDLSDFKTNFTKLEKLICEDVDVNQIFSNGLNPFSSAIQQGIFSSNPNYLSILNSLIEAGTKISLSANFKENLEEILEQALTNKCEALACALIEIGFVTLKPDAILKAVESNSLKIVDAIINKSDFAPDTASVREALNLAANNVEKDECDIKILKVLNEAGVSFALIEDDRNHDLILNLLYKSLTENCQEIFIPLIQQNNLNIKNLNQRFDPTGNGITLLHFAAGLGNIEIVEFLTNKENGVEAKKISGSLTPLVMAVNYGNFDVVKFLIEEKGVELNQNSEIGLDLINSAAHVGNKKIINYLVGKGIDLNSSRSDGIRPIDIAVINCNPSLISHLHSLGAKTDIRTSLGLSSILSMAILRGQTEEIEAIAESGIIDLNQLQKFQGVDVMPIDVALGTAGNATLIDQDSETNRDSTDIIKKLVSLGAKTDVPDQTGVATSILFRAIATKQTKHLDIIIKSGVIDLNQPQKLYGKDVMPIEFPLSVALDNNSEIVNLFLRNGANPNTIINMNSSTKASAFITAISVTSVELETLKLMVEYGADYRGATSETCLNSDNDEKKPIEAAIFLRSEENPQTKKRNTEIFQFLLEKLLEDGFGINDVMTNGATLIIDAIAVRNLEAVKILVERGADITNELGEFPKPLVFSASLKPRSPEISRFLVESLQAQKPSNTSITSSATSLKNLGTDLGRK